jgi:sterol 3beta-glucosyltransferase
MALRAGKPTLVLPFILEQRMWARRVEQVGAGRWLSFWGATPGRVARALNDVLASPALRAGAERMAESMAREDAIRRLEAFA